MNLTCALVTVLAFLTATFERDEPAWRDSNSRISDG